MNFKAKFTIDLSNLDNLLKSRNQYIRLSVSILLTDNLNGKN